MKLLRFVDFMSGWFSYRFKVTPAYLTGTILWFPLENTFWRQAPYAWAWSILFISTWIILCDILEWWINKKYKDLILRSSNEDIRSWMKWQGIEEKK